MCPQPRAPPAGSTRSRAATGFDVRDLASAVAGRRRAPRRRARAGPRPRDEGAEGVRAQARIVPGGVRGARARLEWGSGADQTAHRERAGSNFAGTGVTRSSRPAPASVEPPVDRASSGRRRKSHNSRMMTHHHIGSERWTCRPSCLSPSSTRRALPRARTPARHVRRAHRVCARSLRARADARGLLAAPRALESTIALLRTPRTRTADARRRSGPDPRAGLTGTLFLAAPLRLRLSSTRGPG